MIEIERARAVAEARDGFVLRDWHDRLLSLGTIPPPGARARTRLSTGAPETPHYTPRTRPRRQHMLDVDIQFSPSFAMATVKLLRAALCRQRPAR